MEKSVSSNQDLVKVLTFLGLRLDVLTFSTISIIHKTKRGNKICLSCFFGRESNGVSLVLLPKINWYDDKAYIVTKKVHYDVIQKQKKQLFGYFFPFLKHKQINFKCSKILYNLFGYFFPFLNDVIRNLLHDNIRVCIV